MEEVSLELEEARVSSWRRVVVVFFVVERDRAEVLAILFYRDAFTSLDLRRDTNGVVEETVEFIEFARGSLSSVAGCYWSVVPTISLFLICFPAAESVFD